MTDLHRVDPDDALLSTWLRTVGIAALVAAAFGSIFVATPAMPEPPSRSTTCSADISDSWDFRNCQEPLEVSAP